MFSCINFHGDKYDLVIYLFSCALISDEVQKFSRVNRNIYKPQVAQEVKDIVRKNFTREMEFYEFCKRRLYMQYAALKLPQQEEDCLR